MHCIACNDSEAFHARVADRIRDTEGPEAEYEYENEHLFVDDEPEPQDFWNGYATLFGAQ